MVAELAAEIHFGIHRDSARRPPWFDAEAICEAVTRPNMRFVPIKIEDQQAVLMLHKTRECPDQTGPEVGGQGGVGFASAMKPGRAVMGSGTT